MSVCSATQRRLFDTLHLFNMRGRWLD